jgi:hypothetical protein
MESPQGAQPEHTNAKNPEKLTVFETHKSTVVGPIIACIGPIDSFSKEDYAELKNLKADLIHQYAEVEKLENAGIKNAGKTTYVISPINSHNKRSIDYRNCTGIIAVGVDKMSGENVSFLTHQDPQTFLKKRFFFSKEGRQFQRDLSDTLQDFSAQVRPETIDIVIVGGNYLDAASETRSQRTSYADDYKESIALLSQIIQKGLSKDPHVVIGPNMAELGPGPENALHVVLDTEKRRLFMFRPEQPINSNNKGFSASELKKNERMWTEERNEDPTIL